MNTVIRKISDAGAIEQASDILRAGGLVAFPTETVYGLGGNALSRDAAQKIYSAKGRPSDNPLIVHIAELGDVYKLASDVPPKAELLMHAFWPGPMTLIFNKKLLVPPETTGGLDTVAIRMPSHPGALSLIKESGIYIAAPSANTSGRPSPTTAIHVANDLSSRIDMILDGGPVGIGIESTIVDMTGDTPAILRPGFITKKMLEEIIGHVDIDPAIIRPDPAARPKAPGMKYTHYAPKGDLTIVAHGEGSASDACDGAAYDIGEDAASHAGAKERVAARINEMIRDAEARGLKCAILTTAENKNLYTGGEIILLGDSASGPTVAARLYSALRTCDDIGADMILSESFSENEIGGAVMNRLMKAAGQQIIYV